MNQHPLDDPQIINLLFYPSKAQPGTSRVPNAQDGTIPVEDPEYPDIRLGYRLYPHPAQPGTRPLILFFHGNGEVASTYDAFADLYFNIGASFLVADYRGYGWSSGTPLTSRILSDAEAVLKGLPAVLQNAGLADVPLFVMGRSLGSAPAIHLAHQHPGRFRGLIIESGFADTPSLFRRLGLGADFLSKLGAESPIGNARKMADIHLPLLVIHGERDMLLPVQHGQQLYDASPVESKTILRVKRAGHNDLAMVGQRQYFEMLGKFVQKYGTEQSG